MEWEDCIDMNFNASYQVFMRTHWITDILIYEDEDSIIITKELILADIITRIKETARKERLDCFQPLFINWTKCLLIDSGYNICLMGSEENEAY
jgi:hypothetical protein